MPSPSGSGTDCPDAPSLQQPMREITLQEVLDARDARFQAQQRLLAECRRPLLCFTMNMAGPIKRSPLSDLAFRAAEEALDLCLAGQIVKKCKTDAATGLECIWVCDTAAPDLKKIAMELEASRPVGRLYDLDVIDVTGEKLSRPVPRTCLVCGGPAAPCARSRAHGLPAVRAATHALLAEFAAVYLAELAVSALKEEVDVTPKPGLVDQRNNGAHRDMDRPLFYRSADSLSSYFEKAVTLGLTSDSCMPALQQAGLQAEQDMLVATGGVNTHKGAIYAFGLTLAALGGLLARGGDLFHRAAELAAAGIPPDASTHGGMAKGRYGASGARGEAMAGFPSARRAWSLLRQYPNTPLPALLSLLSEVEDTNLLYRGGPKGLALVQQEASSILAGPPEAYISRLEALDDQCIARNLSPGGCADLLALGLLLRHTEAIWHPPVL